jgi:hypothetical protein
MPHEESTSYPLDSEDKAGLPRDLTCIASTLRWDGNAPHTSSYGIPTPDDGTSMPAASSLSPGLCCCAVS